MHVKAAILITSYLILGLLGVLILVIGCIRVWLFPKVVDPSEVDGKQHMLLTKFEDKTKGMTIIIEDHTQEPNDEI